MPSSKNDNQESPADAGRSCGACNVCCTAMHVAALDKPAGTRCEHQGKAACGGCGIYEHRPSVCRNWYCMWVRDNGNVFSDDERPDKLGVFFTVGKMLVTEPSRLASMTTPIDRCEEQVIYAHPVRQNGEQSVAARVVISRLRRFYPVRILPYRGSASPAGQGGSSFTPLTNGGRTVSAAA